MRRSKKYKIDIIIMTRSHCLRDRIESDRFILHKYSDKATVKSSMNLNGFPDDLANSWLLSFCPFLMKNLLNRIASTFKVCYAYDPFYLL